MNQKMVIKDFLLAEDGFFPALDCYTAFEYAWSKFLCCL